MHCLGLAGMPRRIPDYPDAFSSFNTIATIGSYISIIGSLFFFMLLIQYFLKRTFYYVVVYYYYLSILNSIFFSVLEDCF